jgi:guanylate kinase
MVLPKTLLWTMIVPRILAFHSVSKNIQRNVWTQTPTTSCVRLASSISSSDTPKTLDPLVVCGPSGAGKGTIITKYMQELGGDRYFGFTVSHTTRLPRVGEIEGVHYHFTTMDVMQQAIAQGKFLEYATVHGNLYGTSLESLQRVHDTHNKRCLLDIDVQGVQQIKSLESTSNLQPKYIFIAPPSIEVLEQRLLARGSETPETLQRRLGNAQSELEYGMADNFDVVVVNNDLEQAVQDFERAVRQLYNL